MSGYPPLDTVQVRLLSQLVRRRRRRRFVSSTIVVIIVVGGGWWCRVVSCRFLCRRRQEISEFVRGTLFGLNFE